MYKKHLGFTLAEVLITLGIIGVVAALTLPILIHNYKRIVIENKLKVITSTFLQAFNIAEAEYGDITNWEKTSSSLEFWSKYVLPYMTGVTIGVKGPLSDYGYKTPILYADGSVAIALDLERTRAYLKNGAQMNFNYSYITNDSGEKNILVFYTYIDINGSKGPNRLGVDNFVLVKPNANKRPVMLWGADMVKYNKYNPNTYDIDYDNKYTEEELYERCASHGDTCGAIIQRNGWKIPKDYPIKF